MLPYSMSQTRRALIRRALADREAKATRRTRIAAAAQALERRRQADATAATFAHLNNPGATAAMRTWQAATLSPQPDGDDHAR